MSVNGPTWEKDSLNDAFLKNTKKIDKQTELLCKKLKAHSVSLVYTPCNKNILNPHVHASWSPWQIVACGIDDNKTFFGFSKTAEEAIDKAIKHDYC